MEETADQSYLVTLFSIICLVFFPVSQIIAGLTFPPDFSGEYPIYSKDLVLFLQIGGSVFLLGLTILGMKAEKEGEILAAAGFTAQAISMGVAMLALFDITNITSLETFEDYYYITESSNFLLIPSFVLIGTYTRFKKWIRFMGYIPASIYLGSVILFLAGSRNYILLENVTNAAIFSFMLISLFWAYNLYINYKAEKL